MLLTGAGDFILPKARGVRPEERAPGADHLQGVVACRHYVRQKMALLTGEEHNGFYRAIKSVEQADATPPWNTQVAWVDPVGSSLITASQKEARDLTFGFGADPASPQ